MKYASILVDEIAYQGVEYVIRDFVKSHSPADALLTYKKIRKDASPRLSGHTFVLLLKACIHMYDYRCGIDIHGHVAKLGLLENDMYVSGSLIHMYVKCGMLAQAELVLKGLSKRNVVMWTSLIGGYVDEGHYGKALECFKQMMLDGVPPNTHASIHCLRACCFLNDSNLGSQIHVQIARFGLHENPFVGTSLVSMYIRCGAFPESLQAFEKLKDRNVVTWTAVISGYTENGHADLALIFHDHMLLEGIIPNAVTYVCSVKACGCAGAIDKGQELHASIERQGWLGENEMISVTLIDMYGKCGWVSMAQRVFENCNHQPVILWNALITGYVEHGHCDKALFCFDRMQCQGISPDLVTLICCLKACSSIKALDKGQELHVEAERQGLVEKDPKIVHTLVDMYAKCGLLTMAQQIFDKYPHKNIAGWNALIAGYAEHGLSQRVVELFDRMQQEDVCPDVVSYLCGLKVCNYIEHNHTDVDVLRLLSQNGPLEKDIYVGSMLVSVYAKRGELLKAREVFDQLTSRDAIAWNALATGYAEHGFGQEALKCVDQMQSEGFSPNAVTYLCSLKACSCMGAVDKGRDIHSEIERQGLLHRELIGNTLVDMYAKCGLPKIAGHVFERLPVQDVVAWTALIAGYGQCGESNMVITTYESMLERGVKPNQVTLVVVLSACNRAYLFNKSQSYFESMSERHGVVHTIKHQACLVDLFGRTGQLDQAVSLVYKMPVSPNLVIWHIMLDACKGLGNVSIGNTAFEHALNKKEHFCSFHLNRLARAC